MTSASEAAASGRLVEDVAVGLTFPHDEEAEQLRLEREEVLEEAHDLVGGAPGFSLRSLNFSWKSLAPVRPSKARTVTSKVNPWTPRGPAGSTSARRRAHVLLGPVAGLVLDPEVDDAGEEDVRAGAPAQLPPERPPPPRGPSARSWGASRRTGIVTTVIFVRFRDLLAEVAPDSWSRSRSWTCGDPCARRACEATRNGASAIRSRPVTASFGRRGSLSLTSKGPGEARPGRDREEERGRGSAARGVAHFGVGRAGRALGRRCSTPRSGRSSARSALLRRSSMARR